jgi:hypothetical protein
MGSLPGGSVYKRTYIQQGNNTYISRNHTVQHKYNDISKYSEHKQVQWKKYNEINKYNEKNKYCNVFSDRRRGIGLTIGFITYNRTLKHNTTESLRTPSVFQLTTAYITATPQPS